MTTNPDPVFKTDQKLMKKMRKRLKKIEGRGEKELIDFIRQRRKKKNRRKGLMIKKDKMIKIG